MRKLLILAALLAAGPAFGGNVEVTGAWIRLVPGGGPSAGYLTLHNRGSGPVELVGAECAAYSKVMLHRSVEKGGTSRMEHVDGITVPPGGDRELAPGGYHLMLMKPQDPLEVGQEVGVTLRFADGLSMEIPFKVRPPYAQGPE